MPKTLFFGYKGGTFPNELVEDARKEGTPLTLDMAIPGSCLNDCIFCGYKDTQKGSKLSFNEIKDTIRQFVDLGGMSLKILGEGEPLLRKDILEIYREIYRQSLHPVLFTCGDVLGDDNLARKIHGMSGEEVIRELGELETTVMLKYDAKNQDNISQTKGYSEKRNLALERLIEQGFNNHQPTHLGFGIVVLSLNYEEIPENYEWAIQNNIYPLLCPLMPIGKASNPEYREKLGISQEQMVDLSVKLYQIAFRNGVKTTCPADFPGGLACDIARAGFYVADTGNIHLCESEEKIGNIRTLSLKDAWEQIKKIKDKKYGSFRWEGFCHEKRKLGILPENFDKLVSERLKH